MKTVFIIATGLLLAALSALFFWHTSSTQESAKSFAPTANPQIAQAPQASPSAVSASVLPDQSRIWSLLAATDVPNDFLRPAIEDVAYVSVVDLPKLTEGDALTFTIPQEAVDYTGSIDGITISASGNRSLSGTIHTEDERTYRFLITVGIKQTFATLNTPGGQYQLETRDGIGRLIPTASIKENLDYSKPDYIIPDRLQPIDQG